MSITHFLSVSERTTSTWQDLLNDLAKHNGGWLTPVYSDPTDDTSNVTRLNVTDDIYFDIDDPSKSTPLLCVNHSLGLSTVIGMVSGGGMYDTYHIAVTDKGMLFGCTKFSTLTTNFRVAVGYTEDENGTQSKGVLFTKGGSNLGYATYIYTDNMTDAVSFPYQAFSLSSQWHEQYIKAISPTCKDVFTDILLPIYKTHGATLETIVNGQKYYATNTAVIPYT